MSQIAENILENLQSFLTFRLADEHFAVNVLKVIEILEVPKITKVPRSPDYMLGVINLRGNVLPVIDTRIKFSMEKTEYTVNTCIIVMSIDIDGEELTLGALVDAVDEVLDISAQQIKDSPSIGSQYNPEFIEGVVKVNEEFVMILNLGKVFSADEVQILKDSQNKDEKKKK
ncbi:MAG: chemotaxis protein CheW [Cyclobacteriaceae bacterium]|nr:chemotaxis protein CheW [Cyclobacteriaceae bacterium]